MSAASVGDGGSLPLRQRIDDGIVLPENPKDIAAREESRAPLQFLEPAADEPIARVLKAGADKYGRRNFAKVPIELTTYVGAIRRHAAAILRGEWLDLESGQPHMAHIGANVHVVLGADEAGTLRDDELR